MTTTMTVILVVTIWLIGSALGVYLAVKDSQYSGDDVSLNRLIFFVVFSLFGSWASALAICSTYIPTMVKYYRKKANKKPLVKNRIIFKAKD